jgi:hypothetical protein
VLADGGQLVITVPNAFSFKKFVGVLGFRQERNHPDHVCYYSLMNLHQLLGRHGFEIIEIGAFLLEDPTRRPVNVVANLIARFAMALLRNNNVADEWAIVARLTSSIVRSTDASPFDAARLDAAPTSSQEAGIGSA